MAKKWRVIATYKMLGEFEIEAKDEEDAQRMVCGLAFYEFKDLSEIEGKDSVMIESCDRVDNEDND